MKPPRLGKRLSAVCSLIPPEAWSVADIGAGHGALSAHLAAEGRLRVIAVESQAGPLAELSRNLVEWDVRQQLDVRVGTGLQSLAPGEVDVIIVAGMSANTALDVCAQAEGKRVRWTVLQCVQGQRQVEPWFTAHRWRVLARVDVEERRRRYPTWLAEVAA